MSAVGQTLDFYARVAAAGAVLLGARVWYGARARLGVV